VKTVEKLKAIIKRLEALADPRNVEGMARYGITSARVFGVPTPEMRKLAKEFGPDQELAEALWDIHSHETRIIAALVAETDKFSEELADNWVRDFDNWAVCDGACFNLFFKTEFAYRKPFEWCRDDKEFVRRAAFALMAKIAVSHKWRPDVDLEKFFPIIKRYCTDERNFVKKAVNWCLRQIGKRNAALNASAVKLAEELAGYDSKAARWIARDALRELRSVAVRKRLGIE
jgi:3-methyladenine DNA glycosylase AlkD